MVNAGKCRKTTFSTVFGIIKNGNDNLQVWAALQKWLDDVLDNDNSKVKIAFMVALMQDVNKAHHPRHHVLKKREA